MLHDEPRDGAHGSPESQRQGEVLCHPLRHALQDDRLLPGLLCQADASARAGPPDRGLWRRYLRRCDPQGSRGAQRGLPDSHRDRRDAQGRQSGHHRLRVPHPEPRELHMPEVSHPALPARDARRAEKAQARQEEPVPRPCCARRLRDRRSHADEADRRRRRADRGRPLLFRLHAGPRSH